MLQLYIDKFYICIMFIINIIIFMKKYKFTTETKELFEYIENTLVKEFPTDNIIIEYFLLSIFENEECTAYVSLSKTMLNMSMNVMREWYVKYLQSNINNSCLKLKQNIKYDTFFYKCMDDIVTEKGDKYNINSGDILLKILNKNETIEKSFNVVGVTLEQINESVGNLNSENKVKRNKKEKENKVDVKSITYPFKANNLKTLINEVEKNSTNISKLAELGKVTKYIGGEDKYNLIFNIFLKRNRNNVVLVGDSGVGKTAIAKNIANIIYEHKSPRQFLEKQLVDLNFMNLVANTGFRGVFESKFKSIVEDARKNGNYIFLIDDIHSILSENSRFGEVNTDKMLNELLDDNRILVIATTNHKGYNNYIAKNQLLKRQFQKINIEEPSDRQLHDIINYHMEILGKYHNVEWSEGCTDACINLSKRYITEYKLPDSAIDVLDTVGSNINLNKKENENISILREKLNDILEKINELNCTDECTADEKDKLIKEEISIKSKISKLEKEEKLNSKPIEVTVNDIKNVISLKTSIPVNDITIKEKEKLKNLSSNIKNVVIGQDDAVDEVCKIIKRNRIGLSSPNKPSVLFFAGSTGTGKTYLAKCIAKEIFGDENNLVRFDMSEFVDKMSVNKLYGSAAGYVGYDNGGLLTNAIKKKKHCVLLLDEIEKANEDVHNVFLQLFDEGRLTDNTGEVVDFKNVIIIMTSNVGAKEAEDRGKQIGFNQNYDQSKYIINKEIKNKFKPEFLNRIDSIVHFNKLSDDNLKQIILLELNKLKNRVENIGYIFGESMCGEDMVNYIFNNIINKNNNYGARPIIRAVEDLVENKITDYVIDNDIENGFVFEKNIIVN